MATLAHPTAADFAASSTVSTAARAALERAVDAAPSHVRPPRGRLRRLFARDRSARALIERYRLWPAIEHAYARVTREYGPLRVCFSAEDDDGEPYVLVTCYVDAEAGDDMFELESTVFHEIRRLVAGDRFRHLHVDIWQERRTLPADA